MSFLKQLEERALEKKVMEEEKEKLRRSLTPYMPKECIHDILVRLPLESLQRLRFVCKMWYMVINNSIFIDAHFERSENVLIYLTASVRKEPFFPYGSSVPEENSKAFSVESKLFDLQSVPVLKRPVMHPSSLFSLKFLEIEDGKGKIVDYNLTCMGRIRASCCGLILLNNEMKRGGLVVMNPITRDISALPAGTLSAASSESYGLAFCKKTREFQLVHLFRDGLQYIGCEIMALKSRTWRSVDGPQVFGWLHINPIFAIGALHWVPIGDRFEYIVSMEVENGKFQRISLPKSYGKFDKIMEIGGNLGYLTREGLNQIDVWILQDICGEGWEKRYSVTNGWKRDMVPLHHSRFKDEIILEDKYGFLYAYDFELHSMTKIEMEKRRGGWYVHVNSLVSWQRYR